MSNRRPSRRTFTTAQHRDIYDKLGGRCHWCGCAVSFEEATSDHVWQIAKEGPDTLENLLPTHSDCNMARWDYTHDQLVRLIILGRIGLEEIKKQTATGGELARLEKKRAPDLAWRRHRRTHRRKSDLEQLTLLTVPPPRKAA